MMDPVLVFCVITSACWIKWIKCYHLKDKSQFCFVSQLELVAVLILTLKRGSDIGFSVQDGNDPGSWEFYPNSVTANNLAAGLRPALRGPSAQKTLTLINTHVTKIIALVYYSFLTYSGFSQDFSLYDHHTAACSASWLAGITAL